MSLEQYRADARRWLKQATVDLRAARSRSKSRHRVRSRVWAGRQEMLVHTRLTVRTPPGTP